MVAKPKAMVSPSTSVNLGIVKYLVQNMVKMAATKTAYTKLTSSTQKGGTLMSKSLTVPPPKPVRRAKTKAAKRLIFSRLATRTPVMPKRAMPRISMMYSAFISCPVGFDRNCPLSGVVGCCPPGGIRELFAGFWFSPVGTLRVDEASP